MTRHNNRFTTHAKKPNAPTTAVILAASAGRRMIGYGLRNLLKYQNGLVIDYQINSIRTVYPDCEILIVGGFQHKILHDYISCRNKVTVLYNPDYKDSMSTLSLYIALLTRNDHNIIFMNGDIICSPSAIPNNDTTSLTVDTRGKIKPHEIGVNVYNDNILNLSFDLKTKWGQVGLITADNMGDFRDCCSKYDRPLFACLNDFCQKHTVRSHEHPKSTLFEIDSIKDMP
jgi:choline kinase